MYAGLAINWCVKLGKYFVSCSAMKWLFFFLCISPVGFGQTLKLANKTSLDADEFIGVDSFKHVYFIKNGTLHKQGELGTFQFQDFQLGPLTSVDIINPLNVVLFYEQTNTVVFLDNRLNEKERIEFNELPSFLNLSMASNAGNNRLWVFNSDTQQLELYQYRTQLQTTVSQPLKGVVQSYASNFNDCTLLSEDKIRKINIYGSLLQEVPSEGMERLVKHNEMLLGIKEQQLYKIEQGTIQPIPFDFGEIPLKDLQLTQDFLYIYHAKMLYAYSLTQPKQ